MSGKGSSPRPFSVDQDTFASNWDRIFARTPKTQPQQWDHYNDLPAPNAYEETNVQDSQQ
jgi:hypothetical protein